MRPRIRDFHDDDLDTVVQLWEAAHHRGTTPVYSMAEVIASCQQDHAMVATVDDRVVAVAVGRAAHAQGWIVFFDVAPDIDRRVAGTLLDALERRMAPLGLGKLSVLTSGDDDAAAALSENGFEIRDPVRYLERSMPVQRRELDLLKEVGGRLLPRHLWDGVSGMRQEKEMLEQRLVTPLARPDMAERFGVMPPHAVMLFGPPGTGKTTFAKAVASRLDWPFVELFPSRLADSPGGLAGALRSAFESIASLEHAVVFIDEVEEIASHRRGDPPSPTQGVTNELLKQVAEFRDQEGRLLVCATNFVRALDDAFLRHGRFDYVMPIGLPDAGARSAIWGRYIPEHVIGAIDIDALTVASEGMTPADIEYAARRASQDALARALDAEEGAPPQELSTDDYLAALGATRATVSPAVAAEFSEDIETYARL
ncbi:ATP-binding protein [Tsukamurella pseudospumae]|uniref:AAA family ATPase n=1 Tax=Tsukamurella pseudospumae TaxID=239498 RepID=A0A138AK74_9ACTN|nr:ATP-binding protein [Tsukamurella pseudospumae]KXP10772.1 AAA family ATPase [Tsukamurella pseudospumae]